MSFNEADHRRDGAGKFSEKPRAAAASSLDNASGTLDDRLRAMQEESMAKIIEQQSDPEYRDALRRLNRAAEQHGIDHLDDEAQGILGVARAAAKFYLPGELQGFERMSAVGQVILGTQSALYAERLGEHVSDDDRDIVLKHFR